MWVSLKGCTEEACSLLLFHLWPREGRTSLETPGQSMEIESRIEFPGIKGGKGKVYYLTGYRVHVRVTNNFGNK